MKATRLPPGPRTPGLVQLMKFATRPLDFFDDCAARYGDPFTVDMANFGKFVMVSSPDLVKQVFTGDTDVLHAGKANRDIEPLVGPRSMLMLDGPEHLRHRRLLMPPFHGERMRTYAAVMAESARAAVAAMPVGKPFAMQPITQSITLEIILRAVFGMDHGARMDGMTSAMVAYLEPPSPVLMFLPQFDLPLTPYRAFLRRREAVDREIHAAIAHGREAIARKGPGQHTDILSMMLEARDEEGRALSDSEVRDELLTLLIAGHETTATGLAWAFERVLSTPAVLSRLETELAGEHTPDALANLEYLDAVVKETLRMRPILPDVVRELQAPWKLGEWELLQGLRVCPVIHLAHMREESWPEARSFKPERFLGAKVDPYAWFPFGGGIRRCLGMAFAMYEMKIVLGTILKEAKLSLVGERAVRTVRRGITLAPEGGTRVVRE